MKEQTYTMLLIQVSQTLGLDSNKDVPFVTDMLINRVINEFQKRR